MAQDQKSARPASDACARAAVSPGLSALLIDTFQVRKNVNALLIALSNSDDFRQIRGIREEAERLIDYIFWVKDLGEIAAGADSRKSRQVSLAVLGNRAYALGMGQVLIRRRIDLELANLRAPAAAAEGRSLRVLVGRFATLLSPCIDPTD